MVEVGSRGHLSLNERWRVQPIIALLALVGYLIPVVVVAMVLFARRDVAST